MPKRKEEFQEIAHCGGQFTINVKTDSEGKRSIQFGMRQSSALFAIYVLPQGIPVGTVQLGGIGDPWNPPPTSNSFPIFIASDSQGMFGHQCPKCKGYWRSKGAPSRWEMTCAYCGLRTETHNFITEGQLKYVKACCDLVEQAMNSDEDGEFIIDMDKVADAVGKKSKKPKFYYAEESQQNKYNCDVCGALNDILGRYGYCSICGTHNGLQELKLEIEQIRDRINKGGPFETCVKDAVSAFDGYSRQVAKQLTKNIPMTPARRRQWERKLFHNLKTCSEDFESVFDIKPLKKVKQDEVDFAVLMFHRRHIYEHNSGEADEKYIKDSGDKSVRPKQVIHESSTTAYRITDIILKMTTNIHNDFHSIFPVEEVPISYHKDKARRTGKNTK